MNTFFAALNRFFSSHSFKVILLAVFVLPIMTRGARYAFQSNNNDVVDWLPPEYPETQAFNWFKDRFAKETFVLISWDGCTLSDDRLELFARKLIVPPNDLLFQKVETGQRLFDKLTSAPTSVSEETAKKRLAGLFIGPDGEQSCAVITLTAAGKQAKALRGTLARIYEVAEKELALPREKIRLGGPPVDSVAIAIEGERTLKWLIGPAAIVGLSLAWWCLRSARLTTMVFATALYAGAVSLSIVWYSGGTMNAIMLTMPSVVYVAGISGAIHFANYYRDSAVEEGIAGAPARAIRHAWLPCMLSAGTTAAGLFSLYTSELIPIKFFGVYSACGVLATMLLLFLFLPAWMQLWPMRRDSLLDGAGPKSEDLALSAGWRRFLEGVLGHHRLVFTGLVALMAFAAFGLTKIDTSIKLTKMFSGDAQILHDYAWLEAKLGPLVPMEIVVRLNNKKCDLNILDRLKLVRKVQDRLEGINGIGNTMSAVTFAPALEVKRAGPFFSKRMVENVIIKKLNDHRQEFVDSGLLALEGDEELWRISARVGALNDIDYGEFVHDIEARVEPVLAAARLEMAARAGKAPASPSSAPEPAVESVGLSRVAPALSAVTPSTLAAGIEAENSSVVSGEAAAAETGIGATYTGLVPLVYKAQRSMLNGLAWNFIWDLLTISGVMTVVFADLSAGLILLIPSIFPVVVVFGLMGWMGIVIDVGTIMTPTVALGVSVDDVVHFLIWYKRGLAEGKSRREATMLAYEGCARAMYQSWAVLGLGLAVFAMSAFVPTQRFGALMFLLLTAALVGNLLLLPTVLVSPLSGIFLRRVVKKAKREALSEQHKTRPPLHADPAETGLPAPQMRRDTSHRSVRT